jgi:hypothetical protein
MRYRLTPFIVMMMVSNVQALSISEIMYDPQGTDSGREWVEIYNDTPNAVILTSYKLFEGGVNHSITAYSAVTSIPSGDYGVIADNAQKFLVDYPNYTGVLYDSAFSLINSGEQLILKDSSLSNLSEVTYNPSLGGDDDGSTLSYINGTWVRGLATPGAVNVEDTSVVVSSAATNTNQTVGVQSVPPSPDIIMYLPYERVVVAGAPTEFSVSATNKANSPLTNMVYTWAFGDGGYGTASTTMYTYAYPGMYVTTVEATNGNVIGKAKMKVRVIPPDISIRDSGVGKYGAYIDVYNPHTYDLEVSQWLLDIDGAKFSFPKHTELLAKQTTRISGKGMGFASSTFGTTTKVRILFPTNEEIASFYPPEKTTPHQASSTQKQVVTVAKVASVSPKNVASNKVNTTSTSTNSTLRKDTRIVSWIKAVFLGK